MTLPGEERAAPEIAPKIVREIAQLRPEPGDFRDRFEREQPSVIEFLDEHLEGGSGATVLFARRLAAALWAMYEEALDGPELPTLERSQLETFAPIAKELLGTVLGRHHGDEVFDPEWLVELPRGAQPHLMGFLIGALRAARFSLPTTEIFEAAALLFAVAGALEGAATEAWSAQREEPS